MDHYKLIEQFPSSYPKYQVSLISEILSGSDLNPCAVLYDNEDLCRKQPAEDIIEDMAFNKTEALQTYLDVKKHYFKSRRVDPLKLSRYLKNKYNYDSAKMSDLRDDKNSLFIILFYETYNHKNNTINQQEFTKARTATYKFKDKRDRMTQVGDEIDFDEIEDKMPDFISIVNSDVSKTKVDTYRNNSKGIINILIRQEQNRKMVPRMNIKDEDSYDIDIKYVEDHPVRESCLQISSESFGSEIKFYNSVNSWEDTLMKFFTITVDKDYTNKLNQTESHQSKEIIGELKEKTSENENDPDLAGSQVAEIITEKIEKSADETEEIENSDISSEFVKRKTDQMTITGVEVDAENTTFEIHSENGISSILENYDGMASSLAEAVNNAKRDDIKIYGTVPSNSDDKAVIKLENGKWSIQSGGDKSTIQALEEVL